MRNRLQTLIGLKGDAENRRIDVRTLSDETGVSRQTIYSWLDHKTQRFDAPVLNAFCKYFRCGVGELIEYIPDEPVKELA